jgi:hypothetical protein
MLSRILNPFARQLLRAQPKNLLALRTTSASTLASTPGFFFSHHDKEHHHHDHGYIARPILPRSQAPHWSATAVLPDGSFKKIGSDDYKGKYTVLLFYPFDFT